MIATKLPQMAMPASESDSAKHEANWERGSPLCGQFAGSTNLSLGINSA